MCVFRDRVGSGEGQQGGLKRQCGEQVGRAQQAGAGSGGGQVVGEGRWHGSGFDS